MTPAGIKADRSLTNQVLFILKIIKMIIVDVLNQIDFYHQNQLMISQKPASMHCK